MATRGSGLGVDVRLDEVRESFPRLGRDITPGIPCLTGKPFGLLPWPAPFLSSMFLRVTALSLVDSDAVSIPDTDTDASSSSS